MAVPMVNDEAKKKYSRQARAATAEMAPVQAITAPAAAQPVAAKPNILGRALQWSTNQAGNDGTQNLGNGLLGVNAGNISRNAAPITTGIATAGDMMRQGQGVPGTTPSITQQQGAAIAAQPNVNTITSPAPTTVNFEDFAKKNAGKDANGEWQTSGARTITGNGNPTLTNLNGIAMDAGLMGGDSIDGQAPISSAELQQRKRTFDAGDGWEGTYFDKQQGTDQQAQNQVAAGPSIMARLSDVYTAEGQSGLRKKAAAGSIMDRAVPVYQQLTAAGMPPAEAERQARIEAMAAGGDMEQANFLQAKDLANTKSRSDASLNESATLKNMSEAEKNLAESSPQYLASQAKGEVKAEDLQSGVMKYFTTKDEEGNEVIDKDGYDAYGTFSSISGEKNATKSLADFSRFRKMTPQQKAKYVAGMSRTEAQRYIAIMSAEDDAALDEALAGGKQ